MKIQAIYHDGTFHIDDEDDAGDLRKLLRYGQPVEIEIRIGDDNQLRRRWFKLLKFAFQYWEEPALPNGIVPRPNFDNFRKKITIMSGFYRERYHADGSVTVDALSTAVGEMSAEDFAKLYRESNQVLIDRVLAAKGFTQETVDRAVDQLLRF